MVRYAKPKTLAEALALRGEDQWRILAGGTDFYPALGNRPLAENILDINALDELRGFDETPSHIVIGARTDWTDIVREKLPPAFDALKQAGRELGSVQIQNMATLAGNLCNASPAADGVPALMILDAEVELRSSSATRYLPLEKFILGNRRTALAPGEMVTAIRVPKNSAAGASCFIKLGARRYLVISIAMVATRICIGGAGTVEAAAICVGSCSAVAQRLAALENSLVGLRPGPAIVEAVAAADLAALAPIDDVRGTAEYRSEAARELIVRAVMAAAGSLPGAALAAA